MSRRPAISVPLTIHIPGMLGVDALRLLSWTCWALAVVQVVAGFILAWLNRVGIVTLIGEFVISQATATLSYATTGLVITRRLPSHRIGWLFCASGMAFGMATWLGQYVRYARITDPGSLPAIDPLTWLAFWTFIPTIAAAVVVLALIFPTGHLPSARWRPALWLVIAAVIVATVSVAFSPGTVDDTLPGIQNPYGWDQAEPVFDTLMPLMIVLVVGSMIVAVTAPITRYRFGDEHERRQLLWFAVATIVVVAAHIGPAAVNPSGFTDDTLPSGIVLALAYPCLPLAITIAILRHRLWQIDYLLNRAIVYATLTASVVAVYVVSVGLLVTMLRSDSLLISLIVTGLIAVLFQPVRERLQSEVNRMMYGERDDPYAVLSRLGRRLEDSLTPDAVLPAIVETICQAMRLPYAAVSLRRSDDLVLVAASGEPVAMPLTLPLTYGSGPVGELVLAPRTPGEPFSEADRRLLTDLARQIGVAAHAFLLNADLQRSREQLVLAREEERRRMRRDLHDGLGPALATMTMQADTAREVIISDPTTAERVLSDLTAQLHAAINEVRRIVYDLRPPALDDLGLIDGLRTFSSRLNSAGLTITIDAPDSLPPLPAAVEVATWRLVQEALTNVVRHSQATACAVRIAIDGQALVIEVEDDGIGVPVAHTPGVGLTSMRERAEELGGGCVVESTPRGTVVRARLPVGKPGVIERSGV